VLLLPTWPASGLACLMRGGRLGWPGVMSLSRAGSGGE
jgi:hypothetical protein